MQIRRKIANGITVWCILATLFSNGGASSAANEIELDSHALVSEYEAESGFEHKWREWKYNFLIELNKRIKTLAHKRHISLSSHKPCAVVYTVTTDGKVTVLNFLEPKSDEQFQALVSAALESMAGASQLEFPEGTSCKRISDYDVFGLKPRKAEQEKNNRTHRQQLKDFLSGKSNSYTGYDVRLPPKSPF